MGEIFSQAPIQEHEAFMAAYQRLLPRLQRYNVDELLHVTLEAGLVVQTIIGLLPELERNQVAIVEGSRLAETAIGDLREGTYALAHAESLRLSAAGMAPAPSDPVEAVRAFRADLAEDLEGLVRRGLLEAKALAFSTGNSPRNIAFDVLRFANYMDQYADVLKGRSWTTPEQVNAARAAAKRLLEFAGEKVYAPEDDTEHKSIRHRALTYVVRLYEEIRAAVLYARRAHGDANILAPSLYATRSKRGSSKDGSTDTPDTSDTPPAAADAAPGTTDGIDLEHLVNLMNGGVPEVTASGVQGPATDPIEGDKPKLA